MRVVRLAEEAAVDQRPEVSDMQPPATFHVTTPTAETRPMTITGGLMRLKMYVNMAATPEAYGDHVQQNRPAQTST